MQNEQRVGRRWSLERTAARAPLSLASVKMSSMSEASVELLSHETRAIQGVMADNGRDKRGTPSGQ